MSPSAQMGGAEISILETVRCLREDYEFHMVLPGDGPLKEIAQELGAKVLILNWPDAINRVGEREKPLHLSRLAGALLFTPWLIFGISRLLRDINPSALITNGIKCHILGALALRGRGVALIWYLRDGLSGREISRRLLALLSFRCDSAICISHYIKSELRSRVSRSLRADVLYNIVDLDKFCPKAQLPPDLRKESGEIWFGIVGAVTSLKGQDLFLEAAKKIIQRVPFARFLIVGSNRYATENNSAYEDTLRRMACETALKGKVKFLGFRPDVQGIIANLDILVQSNRGPEGLGRSVLEAMACAVPIIAVDRWGPGELVQDGVNGLVFPPGDTDALAERMLRLALDGSLRIRQGANGLAWARLNLIPEEFSAGFRSILDSQLV